MSEEQHTMTGSKFHAVVDSVGLVDVEKTLGLTSDLTRLELVITLTAVSALAVEYEKEVDRLKAERDSVLNIIEAEMGDVMQVNSDLHLSDTVRAVFKWVGEWRDQLDIQAP